MTDTALIVLLLILLSLKVTLIGIYTTRNHKELLRLIGQINNKTQFPVGHSMNPIQLEKGQTPDLVRQVLERARDRKR